MMQKKMIKPFLRFAAFFFLFTLRTMSSAELAVVRSCTGSGRTYVGSHTAAFFAARFDLPDVVPVFLVDFELNIFMEASFFLFMLTL